MARLAQHTQGKEGEADLRQKSVDGESHGKRVYAAGGLHDGLIRTKTSDGSLRHRPPHLREQRSPSWMHLRLQGPILKKTLPKLRRDIQERREEAVVKTKTKG